MARMIALMLLFTLCASCARAPNRYLVQSLKDSEKFRKELERPATDPASFTVESSARDTERTSDPYTGRVMLDSPVVKSAASDWPRFDAVLVNVRKAQADGERFALRVNTTGYKWSAFQTAYLLGGTKLDIDRASGDVDCGRRVCTMYEQHIVGLPEEIVRQGSVAGLAFKLSGGWQDIEVKMPAALVAGFLLRVDQEGAGLAGPEPVAK